MHLEKAIRLKRALAKLRPEADPEAVAELAMIAATHLVNTLCHMDGLDFDIVHSDLIGIDRSTGTVHLFCPGDYRLSPPTMRALGGLHRIEVLRRELVRGSSDDSASALEALRELEVIQVTVEGVEATLVSIREHS